MRLRDETTRGEGRWATRRSVRLYGPAPWRMRQKEEHLPTDHVVGGV